MEFSQEILSLQSQVQHKYIHLYLLQNNKLVTFDKGTEVQNINKLIKALPNDIHTPSVQR